MALYLFDTRPAADGARVAVCSTDCADAIREALPGRYAAKGVKHFAGVCTHCAWCGGLISGPGVGYACRLHHGHDCPEWRYDLTTIAATVAECVTRGAARSLAPAGWDRVLAAVAAEFDGQTAKPSADAVLWRLGHHPDQKRP